MPIPELETAEPETGELETDMSEERVAPATERRPIPVMPPRPRKRLSTWAFLKTAARNTIATCDEELFDELVVARWYFLAKVIFVSDPAGIKHVLTDNSDNYERMGTIRRLFEIELGTGTLASEGEVWRRHQRIATPSLDQRAFTPQVPGLIALAEELAARFEERVGGEPIDLEACVSGVSNPLWNQFVTGGDPKGLPILSWLTKVPRRPSFSDLVPKPRWLTKIVVPSFRDDDRIGGLDPQLHAMIDARRAEDYGGERDLLWRLAHRRNTRTGETLPRHEVRDEAANLIVGGSTGLRALTWLWYLLALHPDVEAKLHVELDRVLGGQALRAEQIPDLVYTRQVLDEVMRLYPPIPAIPRQAKRADEVCGHRVPAGGIVVVMPWVVHRHRKLWDDPDRFDPERFDPANVAARPKHAYIPFAAGPRVCPGQAFALTHMMIVAVSLARRFRMRFATGEPIEPRGGVSLRPRGGLMVRLDRRSP